MRAMQLQEEQAMKESLKDHLLKQTSQETGVNISDLRTPSNAKTCYELQVLEIMM